MPDAVIVCAILPKFLGSKVVLDVHDTMPELYRDKFGGACGAGGAKLLMLEERISSWCADRVLAVHDLHRDRLQQAGVPARKIHVVTNSPDRLAESRALVDRLGLDSHVVFTDLVPVERLPALLVTADVGLVPYRPSSATHLMLPVKLLDYATLGIPVIAARLRTVEHYFGQGAAELFEPGNVADLVHAIRRLYKDQDLRAQLVERARHALDSMNWHNQRNEYYRAIDSLLTG
jgi:glycosyltransferase involved in cell wall biosynthesis